VKSTLRNCLMAVAVVALTACAALGISTPDTFNGRLASGYVTVTTVRQAGTSLLTSGKITVKDAENIQKQADTARDGLDVARSIHDTLPKQAEDKLATTLVILNALSGYVKSKGGP
jgi:predicted secreted protein